MDPTNDSPASNSANTVSTESGESKSDFGAMWLLVMVVALTVGMLWMIRDVWMAKPTMVELDDQARSELAVSAPRSDSRDRASTASQSPAVPPSATDSGSARDTLEALRRQKEESLLAAKKEAAQIEEERQETVQQLEQERIARMELERQRVEAEKRLEAERAAQEQGRLEAERQLARERAARVALEQQRLEAEQKLARERAQRAELERRAALEKERLLQVRREAEQAERERALADQALQAEQSRVSSSPLDGVAEVPAALVDVEVESPMDPLLETVAAEGSTEASREDRFSSNPCDGPSAKFLSTCR